MEDDFANAHVSLGRVYKQLGISDLAKVELQRGIEIYDKYNNEGHYDKEILSARKLMSSI